ncbi:MAG: hypothetical protein RIC56_15155 [Pseudomonadales bacterium]
MTWLSGIVAEVAAGRQPDIAVRAPVTLYVLVGYMPMALYYLRKWTDATLETISSRFALDRYGLGYSKLMIAMVGIAGSVSMYFAFLHQPMDPGLLIQPLRWSLTFVLPLVGIVLMGWFMFRFLFLLLWSATAVSRTAREVRNIDLLDSVSVKPYAQHGVNSSLLAVVALSICANLWLDPESPTIGTVFTVMLLVLSAAMALLLPTWGIHKRLKESKAAELQEIRSAISKRRKPATRSVEDAQQLRADLALERRLMEVSEWPFDAGSYGRVALYVVLGFGSWIGAALVERALESIGG